MGVTGSAPVTGSGAALIAAIMGAASAARSARVAAGAVVVGLACAGCAKPAVVARDAPRACAEGTLVLGVCLSPAEAKRLCAPDAARGRGCEALACAAEDVVDLDHGRCAGAREARALAERSEIPLGGDESLGCAAADRLVVIGGALLCLPRAAMCPRGARWRRDRCEEAPSCGAGAIAASAAAPGGPTPARCAALVDRDGVVDVAAWARAAFGPDGGVGSPDVCGPIGRSAAPLASPAPGGLVLLTIDLTFPDNDVRGATARVRSRIAGALDDAPPSSVDNVAAESVASLLVPLRRVEGSASAAFVTMSVRCALPAATRPATAPKGGDPSDPDETSAAPRAPGP